MKTIIFTLALASIAYAAPQAEIYKREAAAPTLSAVSPLPTYQPCGGHVVNPQTCPRGYVCVDNPRTCSQAVDCPGICVKPQACGGFAGIRCPIGKKCYDDPRDNCDPQAGGADCIGLCI
ncbi:hypothetical protein ABW20_dc0100181 [Dactylellina cionopaga]|nr:hypothetical protein ABW20_dc0100181 [Dactylellina cionopaga]